MRNEPTPGNEAEALLEATVPPRPRPTLSFGALVGEYRVLDEIGVGGSARVHRVMHRHTGSIAVMKVLRHERGFTDAAMLWREARALNRIDHPGVVGLLDVGRTPDWSAFLVMQRVTGCKLRDRLEEEELPLETALRIAVRLADALAAAHEAGVAHCDLSTGNVMLWDDETGESPILIDFGNARSLDDAELARERDAIVVGTPYYMSPEQARGLAMDGRSDIYSLGTILFEMISGVPVFHGETAREIALQHVCRQAPPVTSPRAEIPRRLQQIVARCLEKDPDRRYQSAARLRQDLAALIRPFRHDLFAAAEVPRGCREKSRC